MEIALLSGNALRIKGKKTSLLVDVLDTQKTEANAYLFLQKSFLDAKDGGNGLIIGGAGEYEVAGTKISAFSSGDSLLYQLYIDGMKLLLGSASGIFRMKDKLDEQNIVVVYADASLDQAALTNAQPTVAVCYGEKSTEVADALGKGLNKKAEDAENQPDAKVAPTDKFVITAEKLPAELQVVLLA